MERIVLRIETDKRFIECDQPLLIFIDDVDVYGNVCYCASTGHGFGCYPVLIKHSRPMTSEEIESFKGSIYGYNLNDFKIVQKRIRRQ